jgi:hypothetical protein
MNPHISSKVEDNSDLSIENVREKYSTRLCFKQFNNLHFADELPFSIIN